MYLESVWPWEGLSIWKKPFGQASKHWFIELIYTYSSAHFVQETWSVQYRHGVRQLKHALT